MEKKECWECGRPIHAAARNHLCKACKKKFVKLKPEDADIRWSGGYYE